MRNIIILFLLLFSIGVSAQITVNTNFQVNSANPIDTRTVLDSLSDTSSVSFPYEGLIARIKSLDVYYEYTGTKWQEFQTGASIDTFFLDNEGYKIVISDDTLLAPRQSIIQENTVFFSKSLGNNSTAERENILLPYADFWNAYEAAEEGDRIVGLTRDTFDIYSTTFQSTDAAITINSTGIYIYFFGGASSKEVSFDFFQNSLLIAPTVVFDIDETPFSIKGLGYKYAGGDPSPKFDFNARESGQSQQMEIQIPKIDSFITTTIDIANIPAMMGVDSIIAGENANNIEIQLGQSLSIDTLESTIEFKVGYVDSLIDINLDGLRRADISIGGISDISIDAQGVLDDFVGNFNIEANALNFVSSNNDGLNLDFDLNLSGLRSANEDIFLSDGHILSINDLTNLSFNASIQAYLPNYGFASISNIDEISFQNLFIESNNDGSSDFFVDGTGASGTVRFSNCVFEGKTRVNVEAENLILNNNYFNFETSASMFDDASLDTVRLFNNTFVGTSPSLFENTIVFMGNNSSQIPLFDEGVDYDESVITITDLESFDQQIKWKDVVFQSDDDNNDSSEKDFKILNVDSLVLSVVSGAILSASGSDVLGVANNGQLQLHEYGSGNFTGTAVKSLSVDANGRVIETNVAASGYTEFSKSDTVSFSVTEANLLSADWTNITANVVNSSTQNLVITLPDAADTLVDKKVKINVLDANASYDVQLTTQSGGSIIQGSTSSATFTLSTGTYDAVVVENPLNGTDLWFLEENSMGAAASEITLPQFDTIIVTAANDTFDIDNIYDQTLEIDMNNAPATVDFVVENPERGATLTLVFANVSSVHTFNFSHLDVKQATKTGWEISNSSDQVYVLRYNIDGSNEWIILRDE